MGPASGHRSWPRQHHGRVDVRLVAADRRRLRAAAVADATRHPRGQGRGQQPAAGGMQQGSRYAGRLGLRFSIASNGRRVHPDRQRDRRARDARCSPHARETSYPLPRAEHRLERTGSPVFRAPWYEDQITRGRRCRLYQEMAIFETLYRFCQGEKRVLLLMATGTGKTFTVFQLAWKLMRGDVLP